MNFLLSLCHCSKEQSGYPLNACLFEFGLGASAQFAFESSKILYTSVFGSNSGNGVSIAEAKG